MTRRSNLPCGCGSGKPYKKCHRILDQGMAELTRKIQSGELPFTARIISENEEPSSLQAGKVTITRNGKEQVLAEEIFTLSTNMVQGDKTVRSAAHLSLAIDGSGGETTTSGNAAVSNSSPIVSLRLYGNTKSLKASSPSGGFVVARVMLQRDTKIQFFDFLFGTKGQAEETDFEGRKNRSHIAFFPDGSGKFLRLNGNGCELSSGQAYLPQEKLLIPKSVRIKSPDFREQLVAEFAIANGAVELRSVGFLQGAT